MRSLIDMRRWTEKPALAIFACASLLGCNALKNPSEPNANLCKVPEIVPKDGCYVSLVSYRESGREPVNATLATVRSGVRAYGDVIQSFNVYFLETPRSGVVALGEFPAWSGLVYWEMYRQVGYDGARGGGIAGRDDSFSTRLIVRKGEQYCAAIVMRPPFAGELIDCGEVPARITGEVGYLPGVLSQREVAWKVCDQFAKERRQSCTHNDVYNRTTIFERDETGAGRYRVDVERALYRRKPKDYREGREYLVSPDGKAVQEVSRVWRLCQPNVGCPQIAVPPDGEE